MNVRTLCLAILHHQEATGYEIRKLSTEGKYAYFVDASFGSIYPALAKLEDEGLVTCRLEQQDGKPARKVYAINEHGRAELRENLRESPTPDVFRSEFLLIGMCADLLDVGDMERALTVHISQVEDELRKLDDMKSDLPENNWLADYGTACMKTQLDWLHANRERILADSAEAARNAPHKQAATDDLPTAAE
ncbi:MAG: PadR family transcriptional regulator [Rhizobiales bacterium]|nr:PadR family transcriptional regulator [Hyphomicrobiales bacterium]MBO6698631.1 PadR family transcriptional regulator [Hyphomicrobiales bacterium]MBO6735116.1 PadR family transcriptional regulator [Hyphomicrobiales bacterium]MBO6911077.1 PadR family transcriptional regulator [Hyphomicrobiales bacterium]MBO6956998.1 PadR family transcriptional regulator [Hyphomicrobiales bacterium]